ncbi:DUF3035 domain-containing protein [Chachezhania antarctica]|uniref:DUF3035 domain-containing protein n=1 Tax=Chachezhania antarctica TaxID=2340860 RepID=UPI000EB4BD9F|nr:DUF3035 domain-containing protein [Chachezhania antarctica]
MRGKTALMAMAALAVAAGCSGKNGLRNLDSPGPGPDEFMIIPAKPLAEPNSYSDLPPPTPGGVNRTDRDPAAEAIVALGGTPPELRSVPASDTQLLAQAGRYGIDTDSRRALAEEDEKFRRRQSRMSGLRIFVPDRYAEAYKSEAIDPFEQNDRFRRAGVPTVSAPPATLD